MLAEVTLSALHSESVEPSPAVERFIPNNQIISLLQSAYDTGWKSIAEENHKAGRGKYADELRREVTDHLASTLADAE